MCLYKHTPIQTHTYAHMPAIHACNQHVHANKNIKSVMNFARAVQSPPIMDFR